MRDEPSIDRRAALTGVLAEHLLQHGLGASSLRTLAKAAGTSDRMLLYYFLDKDALLTAVLSQIADDMTTRLDAASDSARRSPETLTDLLRPTVLGDASWPYIVLWLELAGRAARHEAPYADIARTIGERFLVWIEAHLDVSAKDAPDTALAVLAEIEGWVVLKAIGLTD
ncbi:MAG: TetR/AcrR family transcriptional regulator [Pseudomonadota bacterium]